MVSFKPRPIYSIHRRFCEPKNPMSDFVTISFSRDSLINLLMCAVFCTYVNNNNNNNKKKKIDFKKKQDMSVRVS
jgi:hypothetical protein